MVDPDPTHILVTHTAALPLAGEGECEDAKRLRLQAKIAEKSIEIATLRKLYRELKEELSRRNAKIDRQHEENCSLRAELAKRDDLIQDLRATESNMASVIDKKNEDIEDLRERAGGLEGELMGANEAYGALRASESSLRFSITSLRAQLTRAAAIEEAAKTLAINVQTYFPYTNPDKAVVRLCDYDALRSALAMPSPSLVKQITDLPNWEPTVDPDPLRRNEESSSSSPVQTGTGICTECATSYYAPNPDCEHCMRRHRASEGLRSALASPSPRDTAEGERTSARPLTRIVIDEISPGLWKPTAWEGDHRLVSWEASTREGAAENVLAGMASRDSYQGIKL